MELSEVGAGIRGVNRTEPRTPATLPPVALTPEEAAAVAAALAARPEGPYAEAGRTALEKVLTALEPDPAQRARLLASSRRLAAEAARDAEVRRRVEQGLTERRVLVLGYRDREGRWSERAVEPQLLVRAGTHEFLLAWCRERQELRWFREDRIGAAEVTGEPAPRRDLAGVGAPPSAGHPAGRKLPRTPPPPAPPRLRVLPGGRA
ncbi:WYL domain-containing protein [Blastococcus sp. DSM 46786]|uniref:helix-turn-helix transcriptional regulator n=1 Tax=Blastococcus sp. DSM 46786 TaxID=1798227 RepID=UPI0008B31835|nr:WYL domain-containing protein [Blastococcus sp. DSM 46786]SEL75108.1 WYL domain-containing protein [Blastococcus sp. DSM 46786]